MFNVQEYGIKKTWDGFRSYVHVKDGKYLIPINWCNQLFKSKKQAQKFLSEKLIELGVYKKGYKRL